MSTQTAASVGAVLGALVGVSVGGLVGSGMGDKVGLAVSKHPHAIGLVVGCNKREMISYIISKMKWRMKPRE